MMADTNSVPGKGAKMAGQDYCSVENDDSYGCDLTLPGGLIVQDSPYGQFADNPRK